MNETKAPVTRVCFYSMVSLQFHTETIKTMKEDYESVNIWIRNPVWIGLKTHPSNLDLNPPGGGALPYKPIRDVPFFRVSFSAKILERGMEID